MHADDTNQRLSRISTQWTLMVQAHGGVAGGVAAAQAALLQRYRGAVLRYLLGAVRDGDVAEELAQEFALRFLRGDFRRASPDRGRFRDYLRTALIHLVDDFHRARMAGPLQMGENACEPTAPATPTHDSGRDFLARWREELLERTWEALEKANAGYKAALLLRVREPDLTAAQIAEEIAVPLGKPVTADWVRKGLQRAHEKFADLLLAEVGLSLETQDVTCIEEELRELDLLRYCRTAIERQRTRK